MVACWHEDPLSRPTFREIVDISTSLLKQMGGAPHAPDGSRSLVRSSLISNYFCMRRVVV